MKESDFVREVEDGAKGIGVVESDPFEDHGRIQELSEWVEREMGASTPEEVLRIFSSLLDQARAAYPTQPSLDALYKHVSLIRARRLMEKAI